MKCARWPVHLDVIYCCLVVTGALTLCPAQCPLVRAYYKAQCELLLIVYCSAFAVALAHDEELRQLREQLQTQIADERCRADSAAGELSDASAQWASERGRRQAEFAGIVAELEALTARVDALREENKRLRAALHADTNDKVRALQADCDSYIEALNIKSAEINELRTEKNRLQLLADTIPHKEVEIRKLTERIGDLKRQIDQKQQREKELMHRISELDESTVRQQMTESTLRKERDELVFKLSTVGLGEQTTSSDEEQSAAARRTCSRLSTSQLRTPATAPARRSRSSHSESHGGSGGGVQSASRIPPAPATCAANLPASMYQSWHPDRHAPGSELATTPIRERQYHPGGSALATLRRSGRRIVADRNTTIDRIYAPDGVISSMDGRVLTDGTRCGRDRSAGRSSMVETRTDRSDEESACTDDSMVRPISDSGVFLAGSGTFADVESTIVEES